MPLAWFVLPFLGMRAITKRIVGVGAAARLVDPVLRHVDRPDAAGTTQFRAIDFATGELTDASVLDSMVPLTWASAIAVIISWVFLALIIRKTTAKHLDA